MSNNSIFICKECAFVKIYWRDRIKSLFRTRSIHPNNYYCTRPRSIETLSGEELIVGKKSNPESCVSQRLYFYSRENACGPEGKYWTLKKKTRENVIKFLRK
jgi:hypothetical protein